MDQLVYSYLYTTETTWRSLLGQVTDSGVQLNLLLRKKETIIKFQKNNCNKNFKNMSNSNVLAVNY